MPNLNYQFGHKIGVSYYHQIWEGSRHWHSWVESPSAHIHICASMAILGLGNGDRSRMKCELLNWHSYYLQRKIFQTRFKKLVLHFVHLYTHMEQIKLRSLLCPAGSDWNRLKPVEFWSEIFDHSIGQTVGNFSNFSNRIPIGTSGLLKCPLFYAGEGSGSLIKMKCRRKLWSWLKLRLRGKEILA